ncbi:hypothetical protein EJ03DRAFT_352207 [Teratosphaeria nubilosa]|uniref:CENP-V/GFA domain-containing protein n=1 Tax=Teratosphaeria nubilosa TaxID=161662 RepID=A0A6G1L6C9_9PEZI|nr:hypothetical protein EJ03DRAFT_352207 [Teratosphaeria nubilosa]
MTPKGSCLCGQVEVTVDQPLSSLDTLMCHCISCKKRSGGIASYAFIVPEGQKHVKIAGKSHVSYEDKDTASGKPMERSSCSACGSPIRVVEGTAPETWCLQYGLFADAVDLPPPKLEMFRSRACAWVQAVGKDVRDKA